MGEGDKILCKGPNWKIVEEHEMWRAWSEAQAKDAAEQVRLLERIEEINRERMRKVRNHGDIR